MKMASASCGAISVTRIKTTLPIPLCFFRFQTPDQAEWLSSAGVVQRGALAELAARGALPPPDSAGWVADFGEAAFGSGWEDRIRRQDEVRRNAAAMWDESGFGTILAEVIRKIAAD